MGDSGADFYAQLFPPTASRSSPPGEPFRPRLKVIFPCSSIMEATHIVEQEEIQELINGEFQISAGTMAGKNKRSCPGCKKEFKVERLGEHVKKAHPVLWEGLFTVETLQASIDNQQLVKCTIAEGDHDQKFLICLACDSIRTTDRNHFQKNGKVHSDQHYELATKMIAKKKGTTYVPKYKSDLETALALIDKLKRHRAMCERDHSDVAQAIAEKDDADMERLAIKKELENDHQYMKNNIKIIDTKNKTLMAIANGMKELYKDIPSNASEKFIRGFGLVCELAYQAAAR